MVIAYKVDGDTALPTSSSPITVIVVDWLARQDREPVSLISAVREELDRHDEEEPTWEDCAWV